MPQGLNIEQFSYLADFLLYIQIRLRLLVNAGQEQNTAEQVVFDPRHPYTKALMGAMLSAEPGQKQRKPTAIEGAPPNLANPIEGCRFAERCPAVKPECKLKKQEIRIVGDRQVRCDYAE